MTDIRLLSERLTFKDHERLVFAMKCFVFKYVCHFAGDAKYLLKCGDRIYNAHQDMSHVIAATKFVSGGWTGWEENTLRIIPKMSVHVPAL